MQVFTVTVHGQFAGDYSPSRRHDEPKQGKESHDAYDARTWLSHTHLNDEGQVIIPGDAFKQALCATAVYLSESVPGKGKSTYTQRFKSAVHCFEDVVLMHPDEKRALMLEDAAQFTGRMSSIGKKGGAGGSQVTRRFPMYRDAHFTLTLTVVDPDITEDVLERHVQGAGLLIGVGRFRPQNGGKNGRFKVHTIEWNPPNPCPTVTNGPAAKRQRRAAAEAAA